MRFLFSETLERILETKEKAIMNDHRDRGEGAKSIFNHHPALMEEVIGNTIRLKLRL